MFKKVKNFVWLPLSLLIFITYAIQRGLAAFAKSDITGISHLPEALGIYFTVFGLSVLIGGFTLDKVPSRLAILLASIVGVAGIALLPYTPWGFGLLFGAAAAIFKIAPFSSPLKISDVKNEGIKIAPQASAKNFGGAFFMLFLGAVVVSMGFPTFTVLLSAIFLALALYAYKILPNDKMEGWNIEDVKEIIKKWEFWLLMVYFFFMCGVYYVAIMGLFPAMIAIGLSKGVVITILASSFILSGILRWPVAWIGQKVGYWKTIITTTIGLAAVIPLTTINPVVATFALAVFGAFQTPNYWALNKKLFGKKYVSTVMGLGYVAQYLGAGVFFGKW